MTSETFWTSAHLASEEPDLSHHDTFIIMSSADLEQEELNNCIPATAPRNVGPSSDAHIAPGGSHHTNQREYAGASNTGGHPDDAAAPGSSSGAAGGGGGGGDDPGRGNNNRSGVRDAMLDEESHENQSGETSSTSSGSLPAVINPANLSAPNSLWPNGNFNGHADHETQSEGSGISDATTALITDAGITINSPTVSTASSEIRDISRIHHDNLDASSAVSTLSPYTTTSSSSGRDDKKGFISDGTNCLETSRIDMSIAGGHIDVFQEPGERISDFQISQEDMFACPDERFTSTPSETLGILGFSQPAVNVPGVLDDEGSQLSIQNSSEEHDVPFLAPTSPTLIDSADVKNYEVEADARKNDPLDMEESNVSREKVTSEEVKKNFENESLANPNSLTENNNKNQHLQKLDPEACASRGHQILAGAPQQLSDSTSFPLHDILKNQSFVTDVLPSESVMCKLVFSSQSQSSETSQSALELRDKGFSPIEKLLATGNQDASSCGRQTDKERQEQTSSSESDSAIKSKSAALSDAFQQPDTKRNTNNVQTLANSQDDGPKMMNVANKETPDSDSVWNEAVTEVHLHQEFVQESSSMEVTETELVLHYSPSQSTQSECFQAEENIMQLEVPETEVESEECDPGKTQAVKSSYNSSIKEDTAEADPLLCKNVDDNTSTAACLLSSDAADSNTSDKLSPTFWLNLQQTAISKTLHVSDKSNSSVEKDHTIAGPSKVCKSDDEDESVRVLTNENEKSKESSDSDQTANPELVDEVDSPICPMARHKRKDLFSAQNVSEESQAAGTSTAISKSCQADLKDTKKDKESQTKDQSCQTSPSNETVNLKESLTDTVDSKNTMRQTVIVKRIIIKEILHRGKIIKKTVEEVNEEPEVTEFLTPTEKTSPDGILDVKCSSNSTLSLKSGSSTSGTSTGWMGDISSSKSSSSPSVPTSTPVPSWTPKSDAIFTQVANRGLSGMKTLRSVRRRQCYEIRKNLNLSTPEEASIPNKLDDCSESTSEKISCTKRHHRQKRKRSSDTTVNEQPSTSTKKLKQDKDFEVKDEKNIRRMIETTKLKDDSRPKKHSEAATSAQKSPSSNSNRDSLTGNRIGALQPGSRVMAKWTDGFYYTGCALEMERDERWRILFDDGKDAHSIKQGNILVIDVLPVGQSVYALSSDDYFDSGFIVDHYEDGDEKGYVVEIDGGVVRRVPKTEVILTSDQAACMEDLPRGEMYGYTSICLDNIIEGKRRSRESGSACNTPRTPRISRSTRSQSTTSLTLVNPDDLDFENDVATTVSSSSKKQSHKTHKKRN